MSRDDLTLKIYKTLEPKIVEFLDTCSDDMLQEIADGTDLSISITWNPSVPSD